MNTNQPPTGWYLDPTGLSDGRYWDGSVWTAAVTRSGVTATVPIDPTRAAVPPLPGTKILPPVTRSSTVPPNDRSAIAVGIGVMVAALVALLFIATITNNGSDETPTPNTEAPATAPPATEPVDGG